MDYDYGTNTQNNGSLIQQKISFRGLTNEIKQDYIYDNLNRLKSSTETVSNQVSWKQTFNYDRFGNRVFDSANTTTLNQTVSWKVTNPLINTSDNRLKKDQDGDTITDYEYDKAGNVTLDAENQRFVFDAENRMKEFFHSANTSNTPDAVYSYDGEGRRVRKVSGNRVVIFVYNSSGTLIAEYDSQLATNPQVSYLTADHLGSPRVITDGRGAVISRHDYMAFGSDITETIGNVGGRTTAQGFNSSDDVRKQYTGYERDDESGLDYAQARYYNSNHGRFTSVDPLTASASIKNPQTFNRYSYVLNSPYKFVDPLGLISVNTGACGQFCANNASRSEIKGGGGGYQDVSGNFLQPRNEGAGPIAQSAEPPPNANGVLFNDGTVEAGDIPVDVPTYNQNDTNTGETAFFDTTLTNNADEIAETVAKNKVAYERNKANWEKETKAFNEAVDNSSSFEARDFTTDLTGERPIGTVNPDGTITNVPGEHTPGSLSLNLPIGGSGDSYMSANALGVASANKANVQIKLLNAMQDPNSDRRRAFIKANQNNTYTITRPDARSRGLRHTTYLLGEKNAGIVYDNAIRRGLEAAANYLKQ